MFGETNLLSIAKSVDFSVGRVMEIVFIIFFYAYANIRVSTDDQNIVFGSVRLREDSVMMSTDISRTVT